LVSTVTSWAESAERFAFPGISFREAKRRDIPAIAAHLNAVWPPHYVIGEEQLAYEWEPLDPNGRMFRLLGEAGGRLVVYASLDAVLRGDPNDRCLMDMSVAADWRRKGLGTALYRPLEELAREWNVRILCAWTVSMCEGAEPFCETMGMGAGHHGVESALDLAAANLGPFLACASQLKGEGYAFCTLAERDSPPTRTAAHKLWNEFERDMPHDGEPCQEFGYEEFERRLYGRHPSFDAEHFVGAWSGEELVAMTGFKRRSPSLFFTEITGVTREHRGRGLAKAVKGLSLAQAREEGVTTITTSNNYRNAAMLAINADLGFKPACDCIEFEKRLS
jgi:mycothiol synthase